MKKLITPLFIALSMLFYACSSDDDINIDTSTPETAIVGSWKYASITANPAVDVNGDGVKSVDLLSFENQELDPCLNDNRYGFYDDFTFLISESERACENHDPYSIVEEGTYSFSTDKETIDLSNGDQWKIIKLDKSSLIIETIESFDDEISTTLTIEFQREV